MGRGKELSKDSREFVVQMNKEGLSSRSIAGLTGLCDRTVRRIISAFKKTGKVDTKPHTGRPRKTTPRFDRRLKVLSMCNRFKTATKLRAELAQEGENTVSVRTVRRRLQNSGLRGCVAVKKPFISKVNKVKRLKFAKAHKNWTCEQWSRVLWTDESKFNLVGSDGAVYVRRRPGEALADSCTRKTVKHGGGNIMIWGAMSAKGRGRLYKVDGKLNAQQYLGILQNVMLPSMQDAFGDAGGIFMQDNDPKHTARATKQWLQENNVAVMEWPPQSPDMNPIENLWHILGLKRHELQTRPTSTNQLWDVCKSSWNLITAPECARIVNTMPARMEAVIKAKGGATKW